MRMEFDVDKAIDNAIEVIRNLEDFYRSYTGQQLAYIKIEDSFFITVINGVLRQEFNKEGHNQITEPDQTYIADICNIKNCSKTEDEIREEIRLFLYNIPPEGK